MDTKLEKAARLVLTCHKQGDCPGTAAAGVALAHMIVQRAEAGSEAARFSFPIEAPEPAADGS